MAWRRRRAAYPAAPPLQSRRQRRCGNAAQRGGSVTGGRAHRRTRSACLRSRRTPTHRTAKLLSRHVDPTEEVVAGLKGAKGWGCRWRTSSASTATQDCRPLLASQSTTRVWGGTSIRRLPRRPCPGRRGGRSSRRARASSSSSSTPPAGTRGVRTRCAETVSEPCRCGVPPARRAPRPASVRSSHA